ncbi:ATP-dependent DNA helicase PIF1 isoform X1 [Ricinus communis]|uniref:ATP-dependent DNA helicase PIF1 isoform X1 n=1 Tax=Ricinus communis TaxID=3988 RepID=UPI00201AFBA0|nr:ATP-dependent DNA helicase PIF1 isoform X1 [Ricinus communis]
MMTRAIAVFRTFSAKTGSKIPKTAQSGYKKKTGNKPRIKWTEEHKGILDYVIRGKSVFITGSAGTGKTVLLGHIISILKRAHGSSGVVVTASTGSAACAIKGQTLHSFAGFGIGDGDPKALLERVVRNSRACKRWNQVKVLVVDEISMIGGNTFDTLEFIARQIRGSNNVWGGIQLIVSGDFFQLPLVLKKSNPSGKEFAFEADCWNRSFHAQVEITKVFRQTDPQLINLLQGIRKGVIDTEDLKLLEQCCSNNEPDPSAVRLYPRIEDVNKVNEKRLKSLGEKIVAYKAVDGGTRKELLKQGMAQDQLEICKGARVMLIKNLHVWSKLCNGATGTVIGFVEPYDDVIDLFPDNLLPVVKFDSGKVTVIKPQKWECYEGDDFVAWRSQLPLRLAYALSIHKCQGMTIDCLYTDLSRSFIYGMVYAVLSRGRTMKGIQLSGFEPSMIKANPKVLHFYDQLSSKQCTEAGDVDDVTYKKKVSNSKVLGHSDKTSIEVRKCHFSLSKFLEKLYSS